MRRVNAGSSVRISVEVNGKLCTATTESRTLLSDFLRHEVGVTGTHVGCEHGVCGACTVVVDGIVSRSCLMLAMQADGASISTVESLAASTGELGILQQAFVDGHGLQCGFCTPGILMSLDSLFRQEPDADEERIRAVLSGHLCRCTGYKPIIAAALAARDALKEAARV